MTIKQAVIEFVKDSPIYAFGMGVVLKWDMQDWAIAFGLAYAVGRFIWFGVECYWKWKDRQHGKG